MFHGIIGFFGRLRVPSATQLFGLFYKSRSVTTALTPFTAIVSELNGVAAHHRGESMGKKIQAASLSEEAAGHDAEASSALTIAGKLQGLLA